MSKFAKDGNSFRREWDKEAYEKRAKERLQAELELEADFGGGERERKKSADAGGTSTSTSTSGGGAILQRAPLQRRTEDLQLTKFENTRQVVSGAEALSGQMAGAYYCKVCDCALRDSANYLLHINGKKHNRMLGMSMRAERSTLGEVRARLEAHKGGGGGGEGGEELTADEKAKRYLDEFDERVRQREAEAKAEAAEKRRAARERAAAAAAEEQQEEATGGSGGGPLTARDDDWAADPAAEADMAAMMGFGGFGGSKKQG